MSGFTTSLQHDIEAARAGLDLLVCLVRDLGQLRYSLGIGRFRRDRVEAEHALEVTRQLLALHDGLRQLQLPLVTTPLGADQLVVSKAADGSLAIATV